MNIGPVSFSPNQQEFNILHTNIFTKIYFLFCWEVPYHFIIERDYIFFFCQRSRFSSIHYNRYSLNFPKSVQINMLNLKILNFHIE